LRCSPHFVDTTFPLSAAVAASAVATRSTAAASSTLLAAAAAVAAAAVTTKDVVFILVLSVWEVRCLPLAAGVPQDKDQEFHSSSLGGESGHFDRTGEWADITASRLTS